MYINTSSLSFDIYGYSPTYMSCLPYTKILHLIIKGSSLIVTSSSESHVGYNHSDHTKQFNFKVLKGLYQNNSHITESDYEYHSTLRVEENDMIEYYHIFVQEIKSLDELRDSKIERIVD